MATLPELLQTLVEVRDRTCTSRRRRRRRSASTASCRRSTCRCSAGRNQSAGLQRAHRCAEEALRGNARARLLVRHPRSRALPLQRLQPARRGGGRLSGYPGEDQALRRAGAAAGSRDAGRSPARSGAGDGSDRQRKVHDAGRDDRQDQHRTPGAHPHHRGSDRVHPPAQGLPGQPARSAQRHARASPRRCAPRLREDPDIVLIGELRDLETIESALRHRRDRAPHFATLHTNSAAQTINRIIDVFPVAPARTDSDPAVAGARGHRLSGAAAARRRSGTRGVARGAGADAGDPEPDSRRQGPPDLLRRCRPVRRSSGCRR